MNRKDKTDIICKHVCALFKGVYNPEVVRKAVRLALTEIESKEALEDPAEVAETEYNVPSFLRQYC